MAKVVKFYAVMDTDAQRESAQNLMHNIKHKTRMNNGVIIEEALNMYWNAINSRGGKG